MQTSVFARLLGSRKVWVALIAIVAWALGRWLLPAADVQIFTALLGGLGGSIVLAIGIEDAGQGNQRNVTIVNDGGTATLNGDATFVPGTATPSNPSGKTFPIWGLLLVGLVGLAGGCAGPQAAYVDADKATYDTVAPAHRNYVQADPAMSADAKARRLRTLDTWELRIRAATPATRPSN